MNFLNIDISKVLRSDAFIGSEPVSRGTWICIIGYCASQENGGKITDCHDWADRLWLQTCGVTRAEIDGATKLLRWEGVDLLCLFYPIEQEAALNAKRAGGKQGGDASAKGKLKANQKASHSQSQELCLEHSQGLSSELSGDVKEGKGRERKGREIEAQLGPRQFPQSFMAWKKEMRGIPGYENKIQDIEAERLWMTHIKPLVSALPPDQVDRLWDKFVLKSFESAYERPCSTWIGYLERPDFDAPRVSSRPTPGGSAPPLESGSGVTDPEGADPEEHRRRREHYKKNKRGAAPGGQEQTEQTGGEP